MTRIYSICSIYCTRSIVYNNVLPSWSGKQSQFMSVHTWRVRVRDWESESSRVFTALGKKLLDSLFVLVLGTFSLPEGRVSNRWWPGCVVSSRIFEARLRQWEGNGWSCNCWNIPNIKIQKLYFAANNQQVHSVSLRNVLWACRSAIFKRFVAI